VFLYILRFKKSKNTEKCNKDVALHHSVYSVPSVFIRLIPVLNTKQSYTAVTFYYLFSVQLRT